MKKIISLFNNKGGVGKTTTIWNLAYSLASKDKNIMIIDFDPQCNLSVAMLGIDGFSSLLNRSEEFPFGKTIRSFTQPYIQQNRGEKIFVKEPLFTDEEAKKLNIQIIPGDFWLNQFADILNVGTDIVSGSGLYRFLIIEELIERVEKENKISYDYVLIDLPPSFNTLVRAALYCSDYFLVPCTPDLFSAYCVELIGEVLPNFITDWTQGKERYLSSNKYDEVIPKKGKPKFGGWIFNGFDTRKNIEIGADRAQYKIIEKSIKEKLIPSLQKIKVYDAVPGFIKETAVAKIEDLNVMAPDSINQNTPLKFLMTRRPTRNLTDRGAWAPNQINLMKKIDSEYDKLAEYIINNF